MKYRFVTKAKAIEFLANSKTGRESVWFKTNGNTPWNANVDKIDVNGKWIPVYAPCDAGKVFFKYDENGNKVGIYGYEECKVAYVLDEDYFKIFGKVNANTADGKLDPRFLDSLGLRQYAHDIGVNYLALL